MIGRTVAHYRITAKLGEGGMGAVYRATDTKLGRDVALKVLPAETARDADRLERFAREARAVAALNHPNIVTIYSVEQADAVHFLTMELVEGESLENRIPVGGAGLSRLFEIAIPLSDALSAAHAKGITHRDLKPANIMVDAAGRLKILDFGLAKIAGPEAAALGQTMTRALTHEGLVIGTVPYMSPEQVEGSPVDHRTDIFSLGIILHEIATGERPFRGPSSAALMSAILRDTPRPVTAVRTDLPRHVGRIISRCLEKDPRDRYQTARDVHVELKALRRELDTEASRANQASVAPSADAPVAIAVLPFSDMSAAKDQDYLCEGMAEEIMNALVQIDGIRVASRTSAFRAKREGRDVAVIGETLSVGQILDGSIRAAGNRLRVTAQLIDAGSGYQLWSERYDRDATDMFAVQDDIAAGVVKAVRAQLRPGDRQVRARVQVGNLDAYRHYLKGRHYRYSKNDHANARRSFEQAVALDPSHAPSRVGLAEVTVLGALYNLIPAGDAHASARDALTTAARLQGESAEALYVEGMVAFCERDWRASEDALRRAVRLQPAHVQTRCWLGFLLSVLGREREAMEAFERAREVDPLAAYPYAMTGVGLLASGRAAESQRYLEEAMSFESENTLALWGSGMASIALGRHDEGLALLNRAAAHARREGFILGIFGWALAAAGRRDEARGILDELRARQAPAPTVVPEAWLLAALGDTEAAWAVLERAEEEKQGIISFTGMPPFDPLRADPRFEALVGRLGLPQRSRAARDDPASSRGSTSSAESSA